MTAELAVTTNEVVHLRPGQKPQFDGLTALFINCTLKRSPGLSHTQGLIDHSAALMHGHGVEVDLIRAPDEDIATGVYPDMREHGAATDGWPALYERVLPRASWCSADRSGSVTTARS